MATDTVTSNADSGAGSLRAVLARAAAGDTIVFSPTVFTNATTDDIKLASSLVITQNVTIEGHVGGGSGAANIEIDGQNAVTDLVINAGVSASLDGLLIENGTGTGAAGATGAPGAAAAGGIFDSGTLTLGNSVVMGDTATGGSGANGSYYFGNGGRQPTSTGGQAGGAAAGGIYVARGATLNLVNASNAFSADTATGGSGGPAAEGEPSVDLQSVARAVRAVTQPVPGRATERQMPGLQVQRGIRVFREGLVGRLDRLVRQVIATATVLAPVVWLPPNRPHLLAAAAAAATPSQTMAAWVRSKQSPPSATMPAR